MAQASRSKAGAEAEMRVGGGNDVSLAPQATSRSRQLDEVFELPDAGGVAHFAEGFGFDLADALVGYACKCRQGSE